MRSSALGDSPLLSAPCSPGMSLKTITAYVVFLGLKMRLSRSMRSSGTLTVPMCTSPPNPVGTPSAVSVLKTVVFPEPAKPTRPTFMQHLVRDVDRQRVSTRLHAMSNSDPLIRNEFGAPAMSGD